MYLCIYYKQDGGDNNIVNVSSFPKAELRHWPAKHHVYISLKAISGGVKAT